MLQDWWPRKEQLWPRQKIRKTVIHIVFPQFLNLLLPLVSYSFILLAFIQLNPEDFLLLQVHLCSCLLFSIYLHFSSFDLIGFVSTNDHMFPPPLPSHLKVFFHDSFSKSTLLYLLFCELFLERCLTAAIDIYGNLVTSHKVKHMLSLFLPIFQFILFLDIKDINIVILSIYVKFNKSQTAFYNLVV